MRRLSLTLAAALPLLGGCMSVPVPVPQGMRDFQVSAFTAISNSGAANVIVTTGRSLSAHATGDPRAVERIELRMSGDTLHVTTRGGHGWRESGRATVHLTVPVLTVAHVHGSGNIEVNRVSGPVFQGSADSSGDLRIGDVRTVSVRLTSSGSGNVAVQGGATDWLEAVSKGSGNVDARGLKARAARIATSGSGNVDAWASDAAELASSGSGNAVVDGGARCRLRSSGSGSVRCG